MTSEIIGAMVSSEKPKTGYGLMKQIAQISELFKKITQKGNEGREWAKQLFTTLAATPMVPLAENDEPSLDETLDNDAA